MDKFNICSHAGRLLRRQFPRCYHNVHNAIFHVKSVHRNRAMDLHGPDGLRVEPFLIDLMLQDDAVGAAGRVGHHPHALVLGSEVLPPLKIIGHGPLPAWASIMLAESLVLVCSAAMEEVQRVEFQVPQRFRRHASLRH